MSGEKVWLSHGDLIYYRPSGEVYLIVAICDVHEFDSCFDMLALGGGIDQLVRIVVTTNKDSSNYRVIE